MQVLNSNSSRRFKRELHDLTFVEEIDRVLLSIMACRASTIVLLHCDMRILDKPLYKKEFLSVVRLAFVAVFVDSSSNRYACAPSLLGKITQRPAGALEPTWRTT